jgi:hypothetical protein
LPVGTAVAAFIVKRDALWLVHVTSFVMSRRVPSARRPCALNACVVVVSPPTRLASAGRTSTATRSSNGPGGLGVSPPKVERSSSDPHPANAAANSAQEKRKKSARRIPKAYARLEKTAAAGV